MLRPSAGGCHYNESNADSNRKPISFNGPSRFLLLAAVPGIRRWTQMAERTTRLMRQSAPAWVTPKSSIIPGPSALIKSLIPNFRGGSASRLRASVRSSLCGICGSPCRLLHAWVFQQSSWPRNCCNEFPKSWGRRGSMARRGGNLDFFPHQDLDYRRPHASPQTLRRARPSQAIF